MSYIYFVYLISFHFIVLYFTLILITLFSTFIMFLQPDVLMVFQLPLVVQHPCILHYAFIYFVVLLFLKSIYHIYINQIYQSNNFIVWHT